MTHLSCSRWLIITVFFLLAGCAAPGTVTMPTQPPVPTAVPLLPTETATVLPTLIPTETSTPEPSYHTGLEGVTKLTDCNPLDMTKLDTQMPTLVAASQEAYANQGVTAATLKPFYFEDLLRNDKAPWSWINTSVFINASHPEWVSCNLITNQDGSHGLSLTIPMLAKGSDRVIPLTFVLDDAGMKYLFGPNGFDVPDGYDIRNSQATLDNLLAAFKNKTGLVEIDLRPWLSVPDFDHPELAGQWPTSSLFIALHTTDGVTGVNHQPSVDDVAKMSTNQALGEYLVIDQTYINSYAPPQEYLDVVHALEDKIMGKMFPVQQIGVIAP